MLRNSVVKRCITLVMLAIFLIWTVTPALADVPGDWDGANFTPRTGPRGTVPNPGTQEQELANITFPAPYNVFEFVVTCAACHGGTIDQNAGHFGNWAGTSMASALRDPVFRAVQITVNEKLKAVKDGAGNICIRCHSPNAWLSGRTDPQLNGAADGSTIEHSILLSTDDEGISCEACHRAIGNVTMKRADLDLADPVWNMMAGIDDWPHSGLPYPEGPLAGLPYGDSTIQYNDGMTYVGKYEGSVALAFSDTPMAGTGYTGQTYAVYPDGYPMAGQPYVAPDGSVPIHFEEPQGPPADDPTRMALSLEHPTTIGDFVTKPEFCGSCHDLTIPVANSGMPEQRTYTEWKFSSFGDEASPSYARCQDCHMPTMKHEYSDSARVSLSPDPVVAGWFPYGRDRNPWGGTAFHKFAGANLDLPQMMQKLYPEPDLEVLGAPTGNDTRIFPGMLSTRDPMYDRAIRNTKLKLQEGVDVQILSGPTQVVAAGADSIYELEVKVTNNAGHRVPSGYPDGRRLWVGVRVADSNDSTVYESGVYNAAEAKLYNDSAAEILDAPLVRAQTRDTDHMVIDATGGDNAVMVYEKVTAKNNGDGTYTAAPDLLNDTVVFDNRIPPAGFSSLDYDAAGTRFIKYDPATMAPSPDPERYAEGLNQDRIVYRFKAGEGANLKARAEVYWQTHTREFMEYIKSQDTSTLRPTGPISPFMAGYPLSKNYLFDQVPTEHRTDLSGAPLNDNWGGLAYASWLWTNKGAPQLVDADDTSYSAVPTPPILSGYVVDPFTTMLEWTAVDGADGYILEVRLGVDDATADWDRLAVVHTGQPLSFVHEALNVAKTYGYRVKAFNGDMETGYSGAVAISTPTDLPLPPENLVVLGTTDTTVTLSWFDASDNEDGFIIERQDVPVTADFQEITRVASLNPGGFGGQTFVDTSAAPGMTYNYRVAAYNASGASTFTPPVQAFTTGTPVGGLQLTAAAVTGSIALSWSGLTGVVNGYLVKRTTNLVEPIVWDTVQTINGDIRSYSDTTVATATVYYYQIELIDDAAVVSNIAPVTSLPALPDAPTNLNAMAYGPTEVRLSWIDNATTETGFKILRSVVGNPDPPIVITTGADATAYVDTAVTAAETYQYQVYAYNASGDSALSNAAQATTPTAGLPAAPPLPDFSGAPVLLGVVSGPAPLSAAFTNTTDTQGFPASTTYLWNFGDGATSTEANPVHAYAAPGSYTVTLQASGPGGVNTMIKVGYVVVDPGGALQTTITPAGAITAGAMWRVDGGAWLNSGDTVSNLSAGSHSVEFSAVPLWKAPVAQNVTVNAGGTTVVQAVYTANIPPVADNQTVPVNRVKSVDITLTASDSNGDTLTWHLVDAPVHGTLSGAMPNITYTSDTAQIEADTFTFKVNDGTDDSNVAIVTLAPNPAKVSPAIMLLLSD